MVGKEFPAFPSLLKRRRSPQERREKLQGRATTPRVPQMSQSIPGKPAFPALPRFSSRGSTHTTVARGTALWESLLRKPRGKDSRESHRSLDPREGKRYTAARVGGKGMCMPPLETRTDSPGETPEVPQDQCQHWRGILRFRTDSTQSLRRLHLRERNPERAPSTSHGDWPFLRSPERVPEVSVETQSTCRNWRKSRRFSPPGEMRPISAEASRG